MHVFKETESLIGFLRKERNKGKNIGFVPTMGALHEGHMSLIKRSVFENPTTVCSIFVNPTQFNNKSDLDKYPRTLESDLEKLETGGCNVAFCPSNEEMYRKTPLLRLDFQDLERVMEGKYRPGHFNGVGIVVSKLFNIVQPDVAYFGQKDLQQFLIIKQLVEDLSFNLKLVCAPIVREPDGLAMSSRNARLNKRERKEASVLYQALTNARTSLKTGRKIDEVKKEVFELCNSSTIVKLDYFEIVNADDLKNVDLIGADQKIALCIAAYVGEVRLIDNMFLNE